jgi:hypothetical protein
LIIALVASNATWRLSRTSRQGTPESWDLNLKQTY